MRPTDLPRLMRPSDLEESEDEDFATALDQFFSDQRSVFSLSEKIWSPPADVFEADGSLFVVIEIAGPGEDDIDVAVDGNLLRVRGVRRTGELSPASHHLMEIRRGPFERVFVMPSRSRLDQIRATHSDGLLTIDIPQRPPGGKAVQIPVD